MVPQYHQIEFGKLIHDMLKKKGYVYLAGKPRSGKSITALYAAELSDKIKNVLILAPKGAIGYPEINGKQITNRNSKLYDESLERDWLKTLKECKWLKHTYHITNYEQVGTIKGGRYIMKLNPSDYDLVIIDESHNLGAYPKPSNRTRVIAKLCRDLPHIHLSGTAIVESPTSIFNQMNISKYRPFNFSNFYDFFRFYGKPYHIRINGRDVQQYDKYKPELLDCIDEFTIYMTQEDAGISSDIQAIDKLHYIELSDDTKKLYNTIQKKKYLEYKNIEIVCDSEMKLRTTLHQIESGVLKIDDRYMLLGNTEKVDYILKTFGDTEDVGIMCHFLGERKLLASKFKRAHILSSTSKAEGVDLSHLSHFVIMSSDYKGSKFIQRRERIINMLGGNTQIVNHIVVKNAISEQVYKTCSKKQDFNNSTYERREL